MVFATTSVCGPSCKPDKTVNAGRANCASGGAGRGFDAAHRKVQSYCWLLRPIGISIWSGVMVETSSGMAHFTFGSTLILKWYMFWSA
jgi:hypothetical protein